MDFLIIICFITFCVAKIALNSLKVAQVYSPSPITALRQLVSNDVHACSTKYKM